MRTRNQANKSLKTRNKREIDAFLDQTWTERLARSITAPRQMHPRGTEWERRAKARTKPGDSQAAWDLSHKVWAEDKRTRKAEKGRRDQMATAFGQREARSGLRELSAIQHERRVWGPSPGPSFILR